MRTYYAKTGELEKQWYMVDLAGKTLGRAATEIAMVLMGKNKPTYTPHVDTGDHVVVINAEKVVLTGKKLNDKVYYKHTNWMGGLRTISAADLLEKDPEQLIKFAVKGMLPKSRLGTQMFDKMKVHAGSVPEHGYTAQKIEKLEL